MAVESVESVTAIDTVQVAGAQRLSLRSNFIWTFAGNVVYAGCQWGMLVVLAKLGNPETVGTFALALAVTAPVVMLTNLQLRSVQATDARHEYSFGDYLALRLSMTALALLIIAGIDLLAGYAGAAALVILAVGIAKGFESISDVLYGALQQHERMDRIAISMIIKGVLSLAALGAGVALTGQVLWGAAALAATWAVVMLLYDVPNAAMVLRSAGEGTDEGRLAVLRPHWVAEKLLKLAWLSLPLGVAMLLISLNTNIPRYFVEHFQGTAGLGIFAAMAYLMTAASTVINALGQSASPRLARYYATGEKAAFRALVMRLLAIAIALGVAGVLVAVLAGRELLTILYSSEYASYIDVFAWIMVSVGLWNVASMFGYAATARRRIRMQPVALAAIVLASLVSGFVLVPRYGLWGAAISMVVSSVVAVVSYGLLSLRSEKQLSDNR